MAPRSTTPKNRMEAYDIPYYSDSIFQATKGTTDPYVNVEESKNQSESFLLDFHIKAGRNDTEANTNISTNTNTTTSTSTNNNDFETKTNNRTEYDKERQKILERATSGLPSVLQLMSTSNLRLGNGIGSEVKGMRSLWLNGNGSIYKKDRR